MTISLADRVAPHLPYLRRFARAVTGSQEAGDAYVVAFLEALVADPRNLRQDMPSRPAVYHTFLKVWNAMPINHTNQAVSFDRGRVSDRRIETLTPRPRQAFLLASVEGFSPDDIALIMDTTRDDVGELIAAAGREIVEQIAAKVMIIEDEPLIALELENLVTDLGHDVVGIARTRKEAAALASKTSPGLVLADIQLADGSSGIDAVNDILSSVEMPVIFVTAYPERLLTGERAEPTFLVPKPFKPDMLRAVISQALFFEVKANRNAAA